MGCDGDEVEKLFKKEFKCKKLNRIQNIDFIVYDRNNNDKAYQVDASLQDIILLTDDEELLAQK